MEAPGTQVATRIGFAERWLHRARAQCAEGDVTGGLLTLALADAEVRYALEVGGWPDRWHRHARARVGRRGLGALVLAVAAALAAAWASLPGAVQTDAGVFDGPPIIRFTSNVGTLLSALPVPPAQSPAQPVLTAASRPGPRAEVRLNPARMPASPAIRRAGPRPEVSRAPARPAAAQPAAAGVSAPSTPGAVTMPGSASSAVTSFVLSEVDLIDVVLAASRALQGTGP